MISTLAILAVAAALTPTQRTWLDAHALPLRTVEAGSDFEDLAALGPKLSGARVVALGECTHGSREVFQLKHRLIAYLATQGFTTFGIEASMPDTLAVGDYVAGLDGDPARAVAQMGFWTWSTEEVRDLALWMRAYNQEHDQKLQWWGFDMQSPDAGVRALARRLDEDPALGPQARALMGLAGEDFAAVSIAIPGEIAAGKALVLRGRVRTEDVTGWAGLWARADGEAGPPLAFDNMAKDGPRGTTGWTDLSLTLAVPAQTQRLVFGLLQTGHGRVWFDDLSLTLDGMPWTPPPEVDLSFDHAIPPVVGAAQSSVRNQGPAWRAAGESYTFSADQGALALANDPDPDGLRLAAASLAETLASQPARWLEAQIARTVVQGLDMQSKADDNAWAGSKARDRAMADNVLWLLKHSDGKLVLWAHNGHVGRQEDWMGATLAQALGTAYVPLGFACGEGEYTARARAGGPLGVHPLSPPRHGSVERALTGEPALILDLRQTADVPEAAWLRHPLYHRSIGAGARRFQFDRALLPERYDLLAWLPETTPARQLGAPRAGSGED